MDFLSSLLTYFAVLLAFAIKPGPGVLFFVSLTAAEGPKAALTTGLGTDIGHGLILLLLLMGFELLSAHQDLILFIQILASLYIGYLGIGMFLKAKQAHKARTLTVKSNVKRLSKGLVWAATNPANAVFYAALVPTLISGYQELTFHNSLVVALLTGFTFFIGRAPYIYFSHRALKYFSAERVQQRIHQISGVVFISISFFFLYMLTTKPYVPT